MAHLIWNVQDPGHHGDLQNAVPIFRPHPLGNPYAIGPDGDRDTVIEKYRTWLQYRLRERDPVFCTALLGIRPGQPLACHCAPKRCHGEVIAEALDSGQVEALRSERPPTLRYAGIGSRSTPPAVLAVMTRIAERLSAHGYTLLSGGAAGADTAFEAGATSKEIYLPRPNWKDRSGPGAIAQPSSEAFRLAAILHPYWGKLSDMAKALMARNSHQILGHDLRSPVDFVVCWTPDGCEREEDRTMHTGGTGQAIALASRWGIPVFNLRHGPKTLHKIAEMLGKYSRS